MEIRGKTILALGGLGLVGTAVSRLICIEKPKLLVIASLKRPREKRALSYLIQEYPKAKLKVEWGSVLVNENIKDKKLTEIFETKKYRQEFLDGILPPLNKKILRESTLYNIICSYKPEIIIDSINTATIFAYKSVEEANDLFRLKKDENFSRASVEKYLTSLKIPQLVRHIQILYAATRRAKTKIYIKVGTTGVGGLGLNIPYTHGENKPSSELLTKIAMAGAHTQLLHIMGRTADAPLVKEVKPATAIAWGEVDYGKILYHEKPIPLIDCPPEKAVKLKGRLDLANHAKKLNTRTKKTLKSIYIDNGESGFYALEEFKALTSFRQMEFITAEEVAQTVLNQIKGEDISKDVMTALDNTVMGPSYRAGLLRPAALAKMENLQRKYGVDSVAFESLGPARISKLLYEVYLLKRVYGTSKKLIKDSPKKMSVKLEDFIKRKPRTRAKILSIGIPILMSKGNDLLCGKDIKVPNKREREKNITKSNINKWAAMGWLDLRVINMQRWQTRFKKLNQQIRDDKNHRLSSKSNKTFLKKETWRPSFEIDVGETVGWVLADEEGGRRIK